MATHFHQVGASLRADRSVAALIALGFGMTLLAAWSLWATRSHVTRYEISDSATLEMDGAPYPVQTAIAGRIRSSHMVLGRQVEAGEVLVELDSEDERLSLQQERVKASYLGPQLAALDAQVQSENAGERVEQEVLASATEGAKAQHRQAEAQAQLAEAEAKRAEELRKEGIMAAADAQRTQADAEAKRAALENLQASLRRLAPEQQAKDRDRDVVLREKQAEQAKLQADLADTGQSIKRFEHEIDRHSIRATVSGKLGECAVLRPGAHVTEGQQLATIIPAGKLLIVSQFDPKAALGRVRTGQSAVMRLDGFPWTQYGTVSARVARVASEIRDGKIRVELAVDSQPRYQIPFQHGLPGRVEVATDRITPAAMILRSAGDWVGAR